MIKDITHIELILSNYPFKICAYIEKKMVRTWEFKKKSEAMEAIKSIWSEVHSEKLHRL